VHSKKSVATVVPEVENRPNLIALPEYGAVYILIASSFCDNPYLEAESCENLNSVRMPIDEGFSHTIGADGKMFAVTYRL
jgi:hypothetical protein